MRYFDGENENTKKKHCTELNEKTACEPKHRTITRYREERWKCRKKLFENTRYYASKTTYAVRWRFSVKNLHSIALVAGARADIHFFLRMAAPSRSSKLGWVNTKFMSFPAFWAGRRFQIPAALRVLHISKMIRRNFRLGESTVSRIVRYPKYIAISYFRGWD